MNYLINKLGYGHTIAITVVAILLAITASAKADVGKRISYAIDLELGIAHQCNGTDYAYEVLECKYDYSDLLNR